MLRICVHGGRARFLLTPYSVEPSLYARVRDGRYAEISFMRRE
jgi:hypothetical protein